MQLIFADFLFSGTSCHHTRQGGPSHSDPRDYSGSEAHRRGSPSHLRARARGGGLCSAANGQVAGRAAAQAGRFSVHAFGNEAGLSQGPHAAATQEARSQERASRQSSAAATGHSSASRSAAGTVPDLPEPGDAVPGNADAHRRRHSQGHQARRHPIHDSPRLVPPVPQAGRTQGAGRSAGSPRLAITFWCCRAGCTMAWE